MKEFKVTIPEGYEIDRPNSTFECIKFKRKKDLTYEEVMKDLFITRKAYFIDAFGNIAETCLANCIDPNNATSKQQCSKILALNQLMNVAKYLNKGWTPNYLNEKKWYISTNNHILQVKFVTSEQSSDVYFKTKELAQQAISILGEDRIYTALTTNY